LRPYVVMMRPHQWTKNSFLLAALIFSKHLSDPVQVLRTSAGFVLFCLAASAVYILNDIFDLESDREHPVKRHRPLPSGLVGLRSAFLLMSVLLLVSVPSSFLLSPAFGITLVSYALLNLLYSMFFKKVVVVDVFIIAFGFVLRAVAGAMIIHVPPSHWLLVCTFALCLFLGFAKRHAETVVLGEAGTNHREVLGQYNVGFLKEMMLISAVLAVASYGLYTMSPETVERFQTHTLLYTSVFVLYGIYRFLYLTHFKQDGEDAARILLTDRPLIINLILWALSIVAIVYSSTFRSLLSILHGTP
jgi:4-hydroxybenzoate polyprenyltransferase